MPHDHDEYVEQVLSIVEQVPTGRVTTYGLIADAIGRGGPRQVGAVMASYGGPVPWWRVVRADGSLPGSHGPEAREAYLAEGTPLRRSGVVDIRAAVWRPDRAVGPGPEDDLPISTGVRDFGGQSGGEPASPVDDEVGSVDDTPNVENSHK